MASLPKAILGEPKCGASVGGCRVSLLSCGPGACILATNVRSTGVGPKVASGSLLSQSLKEGTELGHVLTQLFLPGTRVPQLHTDHGANNHHILSGCDIE